MEEEYIEQDLFGDFPIIPVWEKTVDELITEDEEDNGQSDFFKDFGDGFI